MNFPNMMYLDGAQVSGTETTEVFNPATEEKIVTVASASLKEVEIALLSAKKAFQNWASSSIEVRQNWMAKLRDEVVANQNFLRECVHFEMG